MDYRKMTGSALFILLFTLSVLPGSITARKPNPENEKQSHFKAAQKDITTPITTVPNPTMTPIMNPSSISPAMEAPGSSSGGVGASWCVAGESAGQVALQMALDYACGSGGVDCSEIQGGGSCFFPNSVREHASYAFNSYYQKNPLPNSCNFAGTAVITSTDPSSGTCLYPSTSTSSSILNTTNSSGSTVFGAVPTGPSTSPAATDSRRSAPLVSLFAFTFLLFIYFLL